MSIAGPAAASPCADNKGCALAKDCTSLVCLATTHICQAPTCTRRREERQRADGRLWRDLYQEVRVSRHVCQPERLRERHLHEHALRTRRRNRNSLANDRLGRLCLAELSRPTRPGWALMAA